MKLKHVNLFVASVCGNHGIVPNALLVA
uniref:Uncharacterized protein n=1 Tax=Arundo donax TaxID=35708 RepID=A0A0A9DS58_ARUDO